MTMQAYHGRDYPQPGTPVPLGAELVDSNGNKVFYVKVARDPGPGHPGLIAVQGVNGQKERFPQVYGLEIR